MANARAKAYRITIIMPPVHYRTLGRQLLGRENCSMSPGPGMTLIESVETSLSSRWRFGAGRRPPRAEARLPGREARLSYMSPAAAVTVDNLRRFFVVEP